MPRLSAALVLVLTQFAGCRVPYDPRAAPGSTKDFALEFSARALPGVGLGVAFAQRVGGTAVAVEAEVGLEIQNLPEDGPGGNDWDRVFGGLRWSAIDDRWPRPALRLGATWLRADAEPAFLDAPGDYGGIYLGLALDCGQIGSWSFGPALELMAVDAEGNRAGSGVVAQIAWRFRRDF